ncbi:MAG: thiamine biosynthesis protein ApbE [Odoribacter sp.]|nr:thiamine biosynthesis protein ApbE [Odoribacter sp.]
MNNKVLVLLAAISFFADSCTEKKPEFANIIGAAQGTTYSIVFENPAKFNPEEIKKTVEKIFHDFDMSLSLYVDSSIISRINRNEDVVVDTFFTEVFSKSREISIMTNGAFDITVGPLVKAWGFGPDAHKNFDKSKLDSLMNLIGFEKVTINNNRLIKSDPGICLDVNAIAQGLSADVLFRYFSGLGMKNFLIEIGGEVRVSGDKGGEYWKIGIDKPEDDNMSPGNDLQAVIKIKDKALATSGNYRKFYVEDGVKYSHTIDPKTGYPARNTLLSATIISDDCASADGIATACMVMGKDKAIEFFRKNPELDAFLVYSDENGNFKTWITDNLKNNIAENNSN